MVDICALVKASGAKHNKVSSWRNLLFLPPGHKKWVDWRANLQRPGSSQRLDCVPFGFRDHPLRVV